MMRRVPQHQMNFTAYRERDRQTFARQALLLTISLALAAGFVGAAGQHFAAVRYGYMSEELRRERAALTEEKRRLFISLEESATPARLELAARGIGLQSRKIATITYRGSDLEQATRETNVGIALTPESPSQKVTNGGSHAPRPAPALLSPPVTALRH